MLCRFSKRRYGRRKMHEGVRGDAQFEDSAREARNRLLIHLVSINNTNFSMSINVSIFSRIRWELVGREISR
jgi:hypothetical protein